VTSTAWLSTAVAPVHSRSDRAIIRRLGAGHPHGLRSLLLDYGGRVLEALRVEFPALDEDLLDDAMSLASLRAWRSRHRFDPDLGTLRAWLLTIARRCTMRLLARRRRDRIVFVANLDLLAEVEAQPASRRDVTRDVRRCVDNLPWRQREVIQACLVAGGAVASKVLAAEMGVADHTIRTARSRAMKQLKADLSRLGYPRAVGAAAAGRTRQQGGAT